MTCVAALVDKGVVYMAGDSAGVDEDYIQRRNDRKVFLCGQREYAIGGCSSFRILNVLRWRFEPPERHRVCSLERYMNTFFVDELRDTFRASGCLEKRDEVEAIDGMILVGHRGKLYFIDGDFQVGIPSLAYEAIGCGAPYALGSLFTTAKTKLKPKARLKRALEAAAAFSPSVCRPFRFVEV